MSPVAVFATEMMILVTKIVLGHCGPTTWQSEGSTSKLFHYKGSIGCLWVLSDGIFQH